MLRLRRITTWKADPPTLVTWELAEEADGGRVTITHSGWTAEHRAPEKTAAGWEEILRLLKHELETGKLPLRTRVTFRVLGWLLFLMPRSTRTEYIDERGW